jgi:membrane protein YqaA with SNARE-associated domain
MLDWFKEWFLELSRQTIDLPIYAAAPLMVLVGALDSSLLSLPEVNDYITIARIVHLPHEAAYFPIFPAIGSVLGCLILYKIVRGGERIIERRFKSDRLDRAKRLFRRWGVLALVIPALLPPPMPFKIFVAAAGALGYPMGRFALLIFVARSIRYYFWAALAYFLRERVRQVFSWLEEHFFMVLGVMIALAALVLIVRWIVIALRNRSLKGRAEASYSTDS